MLHFPFDFGREDDAVEKQASRLMLRYDLNVGGDMWSDSVEILIFAIIAILVNAGMSETGQNLLYLPQVLFSNCHSGKIAHEEGTG